MHTHVAGERARIDCQLLEPKASMNISDDLRHCKLMND